MLDCICNSDGLMMLHSSLDDSQCIYCLLEANSLAITIMDSFIR